MGDSDESVFWNDGQVYFPPHDFQTANHGISAEHSGSSKRISLSENHQEGSAESSSQSSPLGLTLSKTPSFLNLVQMNLSKGKKHSDSGNKDMPRRRMDDYVSPEKLKASNFPAMYIQIGTWEKMTRNEGDVTAKFYYAKRKMVWEVLDGALKSKVEMQWSDISAMRVFTPENLPGTLEIELNQPPMFYREINPQPRKHTLWQQSSDFTGGQAPSWRMHYLRFPPGVLDKHFEKLLQSDPRLCALTKRPFPSHDSPFFDPTMYVPFSLDYNSYQYPPLPSMDVGTTSWTSYQPNGGMVEFGGAAAPSNANYQQAMGLGLGLGLDAQPHYNINALDFDPNIGTQWMMPPQPQLYPDLNLNMMDDQTLLMEQQHFANNSLPPFPGDNPASAPANFYLPQWE
ncbi:hypothetical protein AAHA92_31147 [Salvia divinorum]|uniref:TRF2/HOY1 PH-like domain-containing protein n=1 Tax=Salvia divinorum TaxID=28513 RepID=A0ABD1FT78_SALDI